jgi:hypothetical protein
MALHEGVLGLRFCCCRLCCLDALVVQPSLLVPPCVACVMFDLEGMRCMSFRGDVEAI